MKLKQEVTHIGMFKAKKNRIEEVENKTRLMIINTSGTVGL